MCNDISDNVLGNEDEFLIFYSLMQYRIRMCWKMLFDNWQYILPPSLIKSLAWFCVRLILISLVLTNQTIVWFWFTNVICILSMYINRNVHLWKKNMRQKRKNGITRKKNLVLETLAFTYIFIFYSFVQNYSLPNVLLRLCLCKYVTVRIKLITKDYLVDTLFYVCLVPWVFWL